MCELLGMVASYPVDMGFSFTGFALRGGHTGPHADGWGLSMYDGRFARTFREHLPAWSSPLTRFLRDNPILTPLAIAHIRKMTRGVASLPNTHPFVRIWDRRHIVFAHNGTLPNVKDRPLRYESTLGDTDSEHAFCVMLEALRAKYGAQVPSDPLELGRSLYELANDLGSDGILNFLLADGDHLYARCGDSLHWTQRANPREDAMLQDAEVRVRVGDILGPADDMRMVVVATAPLTPDETWTKLAPGTLCVFAHGDLLHAIAPPPDYQPPSSAAPAWEPA